MIKKFIFGSALLSALALGLASCDKGFEVGDELVPQANTANEQVAYIRPDAGANNIPVSGLQVLVTPAGTTASGEVLFKLRLTQAPKVETTVVLSLLSAEEVLASYEAAGGMAELATAIAPDGLIGLSTTSVVFAPGQKEMDVKATLVNASLLNEQEDGHYLAGIKVASTTDGRVSTDYQTVFLTVSRTYRRVKPLLEADLSKFTKIETTAFDASPSTWDYDGMRYGADRAFDGLFNTGWLLGYGDHFRIDFKEKTALIGIRLAPLVNDRFERRSVRRVRITLIGEDNKETDMGEHSFNSTLMVGDFYNLELYSPVECKSIKIVSLSPVSTYAISELEFYK